jgi:hypothetical protein
MVKDYDPLMIPMVLDYFTEQYLRTEKRIIPEYYPDLLNVFDPSTTARKIQDLEKTNAVLVPKWVVGSGETDLLDPRTELPPEFVEKLEASERHSFSMLFLYPVRYEMKNRRFNAYWAVARYLVTYFRPVRTEPEDKDWIFMTRIGSKADEAVKATSQP